MFQGEDNLESMKYKAFISYKHNEDSKQQAAALESALKKYAKPIFKAPIKIFRDEKEILPGNDLDYTITKALRESEYLIYLASREAAQSQWIQDEIRIWCEELKRTNNLIIILLKDDISVDIQNKSINLNKTSALPLLLQNHLNTIPVFIDMKWAKVDNSLDLNNLSYREIINKLVARFNNKTPAEMNDEQVKIDRKNKRLRNISISLISILTLIAIFFAWYANSQKNIAIKSIKESRVRWLVAESYRELPKDNTRALRLAEAAYNLSKPAPPESVYQAISAAGQSSMFRPFYISIKVYKGKLSAISTDLKYILISNNNKVELYELDGKLLYELSYPEHIELAMFSPSGHLVIAGTKHSFDLYDLKGKKLSDFQFGIGSIKNITSEFSSDGQLIIFNIETYNDDSYVMLFDQYGNRLWEIHHNAVKLRPELSKNGHLIKIENKQKIELWEIQNNNKQNNKLNVVLAAQIGINDIRFNKAIELPKNRNVYRYQEDWQCLFSPDSEKILLLIEKRIVYLIDLSQLLFIQLKHKVLFHLLWVAEA